MYKEESRTDLGLIRIHDNVIASIAAIAAMEIEGVKGIGKDFKAGLLELIDRKRRTAIKVERDKNGELTIHIPLIVKYGFNIPEIANRSQENVRGALEKMTGLSIKDINVDVQGIEKEDK
jgi:uncharacterized alkaline shock family protein YloU